MASSSVDAQRILGSQAQPVTVWDSATFRRWRSNPLSPQLFNAIDDLGRGSRTAQGLNHALTSVDRLHENPGHRLYLLARERTFIGILKVGVKKLFIRTKLGDLKEISPLCVLDFYVTESEQRSGNGKFLYESMLSQEGVMPHHLGYDRPSSKFLGFLRKHYGLSDFVPQTNNFVVFEQHFGSSTASPSASPGASVQRRAPPSFATSPPPAQQQQQQQQPPPATSETTPSVLPPRPAAVTGGALAATLPPARLSNSMPRREPSPMTRSSAGYNIITLAEDEMTPLAHRGSASPAQAARLSRSQR